MLQRTCSLFGRLSGKEGTSLICSFWLVSALAIVAEMQRARRRRPTRSASVAPAHAASLTGGER
jgi:hypothetical protein